MELWLPVKGSVVHLREIGEAIKSSSLTKSNLNLSSKLNIYCAPESRAVMKPWFGKPNIGMHRHTHLNIFCLNNCTENHSCWGPACSGESATPVHKKWSPNTNFTFSQLHLHYTSRWHFYLVWKSKLKCNHLCVCGLPVAFGVSKPLHTVKVN